LVASNSDSRFTLKRRAPKYPVSGKFVIRGASVATFALTQSPLRVAQLREQAD
jgi:hypothetical protein